MSEHIFSAICKYLKNIKLFGNVGSAIEGEQNGDWGRGEEERIVIWSQIAFRMVMCWLMCWCADFRWFEAEYVICLKHSLNSFIILDYELETLFLNLLSIDAKQIQQQQQQNIQLNDISGEIWLRFGDLLICSTLCLISIWIVHKFRIINSLSLLAC